MIVTLEYEEVDDDDEDDDCDNVTKGEAAITCW